MSADPDRADPTDEAVILTAEQPFANHNGGQILFGPDGMLYIGLGDGGAGGDPEAGARSLADLLGSILRVDVRGGTGYTVAAGQSVRGPDRRPARDLELRASQSRGASASTAPPATSTSATWARTPWEEIDVATAAEGAGRGVNYGWNIMEGATATPRAAAITTGLTLPGARVRHSRGCSVTGGYVYRGAAIPALQGHYFYADYCSGWVRSFRMQPAAASPIRPNGPRSAPAARCPASGRMPPASSTC